MAYQRYTDMLANTSGSLSNKVSALMMHYSDEWGWQGSDSIIADILDNGLNVQSTITILEAALHHECQTETLRAAVQAILDYQTKGGMQANRVGYQGAKAVPLQSVLTESAVIS
jgi:hypothetical protein